MSNQTQCGFRLCLYCESTRLSLSKVDAGAGVTPVCICHAYVFPSSISGAILPSRRSVKQSQEKQQPADAGTHRKSSHHVTISYIQDRISSETVQPDDIDATVLR